MQKIFFTILIFILLTGVQHAYAFTPTPTTSPSDTASDSASKQINALKDRITKKVSQLNLVEKKGLIGTVTDVSDTQLTLSNKDGNTSSIDVDELTKFSSPSAKSSFGISDITKGSSVGVLGLYNKDSKRTLARFVDVLINPLTISGSVSAVDSDNFTFTVITPDQKELLMDVSTITKIFAYTKDGGLVKSGFSKLKQGERVFVVGFPDKNKANKILVSRAIRLSEVPSNPLIPRSKLESGEDASVTPSTGSGMKLVPLNNTKK